MVSEFQLWKSLYIWLKDDCAASPKYVCCTRRRGTQGKRGGRGVEEEGWKKRGGLGGICQYSVFQFARTTRTKTNTLKRYLLM